MNLIDFFDRNVRQYPRRPAIVFQDQAWSYQQVAADELIAICRQRLGPVKTPKSVDFVISLPRSPVGKVMRRAVRDAYRTGQARRV